MEHEGRRCFFCGHEYEPPTRVQVDVDELACVIDGEFVKLTLVEIRIVEALVDAWPRSLDKGYLCDVMHGGYELADEIDVSEETVGVHLLHIRRKFKRFGVQILNRRPRRYVIDYGGSKNASK